MKGASRMIGPCSADVLRREVERFLEAAQRRCEVQHHPRRRSRRRYHRSWPLQIVLNHNEPLQEFGAALHNASELGIAFFSARTFPVGTRILLRLFWHDERSPLVPVVVRHNTPTEHGHLIGCEFAIRNEYVEEVPDRALPQASAV